MLDSSNEQKNNLKNKGKKMERTPIIAGNWKMNKTQEEAKTLLADLKSEITDSGKAEIIVCPTFTSLNVAVEAVAGSSIKVGAQNLHWAESGAFTGEISAAMLKGIPVEYVIIGHSERRQYFGETDATVNARLQTALKAELKPIVCLGESKEQREAKETEKVVEKQLLGGLEGLSEADMNSVVLAYEPVWAIGTGLTATPDQAQNVHAFIRGLIEKRFSKNVASAVRILYGGSVKAVSAGELLGQPDIDGALVGGASLKASEFAGIIAAC